MKFLLDTNVISEVRKGTRCDANVAAWWADVPERDLHLSALVLGEIRSGVERARPRDPARAAALDAWLTAIRRAFADRVLPVDDAVADEWGRMTAIRPLSTIDALLAATAKRHGMTLVTRNVADVAGLGASILDPFTPRADAN